MNEVKSFDLAVAVILFAFHENLPDERRNRIDGRRNCEKTRGLISGIGQPLVNALPDSPDSLFAGQRVQHVHGTIGHKIVKLADKSLIGTEDDHTTCRLRDRANSCLLLVGAVTFFPRFLKQTASPISTVR